MPSRILTFKGFTERKLDSYTHSDGVYEYPALAQVLAYLVEMSPVVLVLVVMIYQVIKHRSDLRTVFRSDKWRPRDDWRQDDEEEAGVENKNYEEEK